MELIKFVISAILSLYLLIRKFLLQSVSLTDEYIDQLNEMYFNQLNLVTGVQWGLIAVSSVWTVASAGYVVYKYRQG